MMKPGVVTSMRNLIIATCAFLAGALVSAPSASLQQGGAFTLGPSIVPSGSGASSSCTKRIEGSIGQASLGTSSGPGFALESGFWPNTVTCPLALSPITQFFTTAGGPGSLNVISAGSCGWIASVNADWITLTSSDTGTGNEVVTFEVRENFTGSPRQASINIGGFAQLIVQDAGLGEDCSYSINPRFESFAASGGSGTINVIAEERCAWQAVSSVGWITITSQSVGVGNGTVEYCVEANSGGSSRRGLVIIAGKTFAVKQK
jgi:hypothetical protein